MSKGMLNLSMSRNLQAIMSKHKLQVPVLNSNPAKLWGRQACDRLSCSLLYQALVQIGVHTTRKSARKLDKASSYVLLYTSFALLLENEHHLRRLRLAAKAPQGSAKGLAAVLQEV